MSQEGRSPAWKAQHTEHIPSCAACAAWKARYAEQYLSYAAFAVWRMKQLKIPI